MRKGAVILVALLLLIIVVTSISYAWSDDSGPWGRRGRHRGGGRHGVAEPVAISLIAIGLAGIGIYALKKRKKG